MKVRFAVAPPTEAASGARLGEFLDLLERSEFDGMWLSDLPLSRVVDPLVGLGFAAARTQRLKLGANVVSLGRNPFLLAKGLAQVDRISKGRLLLSFVTGIGGKGERQALGAAAAERGLALEDGLRLAREWWAGGRVTSEFGQWTFEELELGELPVQEPLEVWLGGIGPKALDRVGRIADGWLGALLAPREAQGARRSIEDAARRAGREIDPEHYGMSIAYSRSEPEPEVLNQLTRRRPGLDPLEVVAVGDRGLKDIVGRYQDSGLSKFVLRPLPARELKEQSLEEELGWLAEAVLDLQT